jgi:carotenoid cleavage dioxygenase-like enzyme
MQQEVVIKASRSNLAPIPFECDAPHLKVVGELPRELNGTLYRNGPNPQFEAPGAHWFVGDGMLHAFHLENGRASYRNRWVRTPKWQAEHDAGRALFGGFGRKLPDAPASIIQDGGVANTNIIFHAGRLLALEEGHLPTEIEPGTLNRLGYCNYKGGIAGPFTVTGEMVFFGSPMVFMAIGWMRRDSPHRHSGASRSDEPGNPELINSRLRVRANARPGMTDTRLWT